MIATLFRKEDTYPAVPPARGGDRLFDGEDDTMRMVKPRTPISDERDRFTLQTNAVKTFTLNGRGMLDVIACFAAWATSAKKPVHLCEEGAFFKFVYQYKRVSNYSITWKDYVFNALQTVIIAYMLYL